MMLLKDSPKPNKPNTSDLALTKQYHKSFKEFDRAAVKFQELSKNSKNIGLA